MMKYKFQILAVLIIIFVVSTPLLVFYNRTKGIIINEAGNEAENVSIAIATFLERDIEPYKSLNNVEQYDLEPYDRQYYQEMLVVFQQLKSKTGADFIFTEKLVSKETVAYILDGESTDSEEFSPIGTLDGTSKPELDSFLNGTPTATGLIRYPVWGSYITGFAPIRDPVNNEVIGLVGVDFSADYITTVLGKLNTVMTILFAIIASALSLLVVILINKHIKRINQDFLTGLNNRKAFEETVQNMIKAFKSKKVIFTIMIIDIDKFKQINDTYGHGIGDLALKRVAVLIRSSLKETDFSFRYGGDEFVVILPDTSKEQAGFISKHLTDEFCNANFRIDENQTVKLCVSVGLAEYSPDISIEQLLQQADEEMYQLKFSKQKFMQL